MQSNQDPKSYRLVKVTSALVVVASLASVGSWYYFANNTQPEPTEINPLPHIELPEDELPITPLPTVPIPEPMPQVQPELELPVEQADEPALETESDHHSEPAETVGSPPPAPLPALNDSDPFALEQLIKISEGMQFTQAFKQSDLIRRFVVWLDNLASGKVLREQGPFNNLESRFSVLDIDGSIYLDPAGYRRYDAYAQFASNLDSASIAKLYQYTSPLLQSAFEELGYEGSTLDQVVIAALDELLSAPEITKPMELVTFSVNYKFAEKELEQLSDAQKMMIRMGPDNAKKVKQALQRLKQHLTASF